MNNVETPRGRALRKIEEIQRISTKGKVGSVLSFVVDAVVWLMKDRIDQLVEEANSEPK